MQRRLPHERAFENGATFVRMRLARNWKSVIPQPDLHPVGLFRKMPARSRCLAVEVGSKSHSNRETRRAPDLRFPEADGRWIRQSVCVRQKALWNV